MQTVILSINKPHTDNIFDGIKKLEARKNFPYIESPYKVLVYETKKNKGVGAIIGEFFCPYCLCYTNGYDEDIERIKKETCLTEKQLADYLNNKKPYFWGIEKPKRYKTKIPLPLFNVEHPPQSWCYLYPD